MNTDEAIDVCNRWFAHVERQKQKSQRLQELAALARTGPEGQRKAQQELRTIDRQPTVFDGATLLPAVKHLVSVAQPSNPKE